jgi:hypothetical protein
MTSELDMMPCEPSAVLPAQMPGGARWDADTSGPRALMLAVLEDAIRCIEEGRGRCRFDIRRRAAEAEAWVRCDRGEWPFSYVNICEVLGFDPDAVRVRLLHAHRTRVPAGRARRTLAPPSVRGSRTRGDSLALPGRVVRRETASSSVRAARK